MPAPTRPKVGERCRLCHRRMIQRDIIGTDAQNPGTVFDPNDSICILRCAQVDDLPE